MTGRRKGQRHTIPGARVVGEAVKEDDGDDRRVAVVLVGDVLRHHVTRIVAALLRGRDVGVVIADSKLDGGVRGEAARLHPLLELHPQLGNALRSIGTDITHVGDVVWRQLSDLNAHGFLLAAFAKSIRPARPGCFAWLANLFAWIALVPVARAPARGPAIPPGRRAHAEPRAEGPRERRR